MSFMALPLVASLPHLVALAAVLAVAIVLRLAWRQLFVRGGEPGRIDRWLAEYTGTPTFLLIVAIGIQVIFAHLATIPEVAPLTTTRYISGATYIFTVLAS